MTRDRRGRRAPVAAAPVRATGIGSWPGTSAARGGAHGARPARRRRGRRAAAPARDPGPRPGRRHHRAGRRAARRPARRPAAERVAVRRPARAATPRARHPSRARTSTSSPRPTTATSGRSRSRSPGRGPSRRRCGSTVASARSPTRAPCADLVASLADGIRAHVADVRRLVPGRRGRAPARRAVAARRARGVAADVVRLRPGARGRPAGRRCAASRRCSPPTTVTTVVHCCHPSAPLPLLRATGAGALAVDLTDATPARWESVAATLDAGTGVWAGCLPTDGCRHRRGRPGARARGLRAGGAGRPTRCADSSCHPPAGWPHSHPRGPAAFSVRRSTPRAVSERRCRRDAAATRALAGEVPRARADLGLELPAHEGGARVALGRADLRRCASCPVPRSSACCCWPRAAGCRPVRGCGATCSSAACSSVRCRSRCSRCPRPGSARRWPASATPRHRSSRSSRRMAILPGERVTGSRLVAVLVGFLGVVTIMQPWTSVDRPDLVGFSMALVGGASYGIGWTYNRRFLSGVDLGGLSQPAATLLTALVLMVPVMLGWAAFQPEGLAAIWSYDAPDSGHVVLAAAGVRARARAGRHRLRLHAAVRRRARRRPGHRLDDHLPHPRGVGAARGARARRAPRPVAGRRLRHRARARRSSSTAAARARGRRGARARAGGHPGR